MTTPVPGRAPPNPPKETYLERLAEGEASESTDTKLRYAGYASKVKRLLLSAHRYIAYTSEIGESFRPVAHPYLIKGAYAVSWAYLFGDVGYEGYKQYLHNHAVRTGTGTSVGPVSDRDTAPGQKAIAAALPAHVPAIEDYRAVMAQRAVFQSIASMGLPAFTVHTIVKHSAKWLKNAKNARIRSYGPVGLGLAAVPALPYMFDEPVEHIVEAVFHKGFELVGGPSAVGHPAGGVTDPVEQAAAAREKKEL